MKIDVEKLDFAKMDGVVMAVVQDVKTKDVLMVGVQDRAAVEKTLETGKVTFFSRTKQKLWTKGETSGNFLKVVEVKVDCDFDTTLWLVEAPEATCHLGNFSCFSSKK